jgi:hypothetical protein
MLNTSTFKDALELRKQLERIKKDVKRSKLNPIDVETVWDMGVDCWNHFTVLYDPKRPLIVRKKEKKNRI